MKECRICNVILDGDNHSDFICDKHISSGLSRSFDGLIFNYEQQVKQLESILKSILIETENGLRIRQLTRNKIIDLLGTWNQYMCLIDT